MLTGHAVQTGVEKWETGGGEGVEEVTEEKALVTKHKEIKKDTQKYRRIACDRRFVESG